MIKRVVFLLDVENPVRRAQESGYVSQLYGRDDMTLHRVAGGVIVRYGEGANKGAFYPDHVIKSVEFEGHWEQVP